MNYKSCLVQLVILVALALTLLQYLTTTITFSVLGRTIVVKRKSENETLKLKIVSPEIRNHSKTTSSLNNQSHVSKKFAKLTHKKHTANQKLQKQVQQRNKKYKILFWGKFYERSTRSSYCIKDEHSMDFCEYKCEYSVDQRSLNQSDAVVIHGRDGMKYLPPHRAPHQKWVFLMFESPRNSWIKLSKLNNTFDWTMSYRTDSDVFIPYGKLIPTSDYPDTLASLSERGLQNSEETLGFKQLAAWAVSNCLDGLVTSERKAMVDELSKFIPIDVYGTCGLYQCPGTSTTQCDDPQKCFKYLGPRYKFYLSFENSICEDYITEKFFLALSHGMVPVVHGPRKADYLKHAPDHSFIHVEDFPDLKELADYLVHLDENDEEYLAYFQWREDFVMDKVYYFQRAWCSLCKKLHEDKTKSSQLYSSIHDWWFYKGDVKKKEICRDVVVSKNGMFEYH